MKTRHLWAMFFGVKGAIFLASISFVIFHYMVTGADEKGGINSLSNGLTQLMYAVQKNDLNGVQALIKKGAELDVQSTAIWTRDPKLGVDGSTALHMAGANLDNPVAEKIAAALVNAGANVRIKNRAVGETVLHSTLFKSNTLDERVPNLIARLVKNGIDINAQNNDGDTILHYAVGNFRSDLVDALRGPRFGSLVNQNLKNKKGQTAEDVSKRTRPDLWKKDVYPPVFKPGDRDINGFTGLMLAVIRGDEDYVKKMPAGEKVIKEAIDLGTSGDEYGYTALEEAIMHQRPTMVKLLIEKGANPNIKDRRGNAPLLLIYKLESPEDRIAVIDDLAPKANLNLQNARGDTILHLAVRRRDAALIKYLLSKYAQKLSLTVANINNDTPGQLAKRLGYRDIQGMLGM